MEIKLYFDKMDEVWWFLRKHREIKKCNIKSKTLKELKEYGGKEWELTFKCSKIESLRYI